MASPVTSVRAAEALYSQTSSPLSTTSTGIGNAWMRDDGFGGEVAKVLGERELPRGVHVIDFGSGGLDLAYEVMRGYDALILIDVSRQGGTPGTLYVMEASEDDVDGQIEDGQLLDPHGMDPQTVLRFVKYVVS